MYGPSRSSTGNMGNRYSYSSYLNDEPMPDAASEKEQGNEYFKQKKFTEAIECYSRSIGFSPTAVAFANRAMAYLKLRRFQEAENDCTEALNLDDRYVKAYSRRITARKELGKLKEAMDDADFSISIDPNNPELRKQYSEIKALHMEKLAKRTTVPAKRTGSESDIVGDKKDSTSNLRSGSQKGSFMEVDSPRRVATEIRENANGRSKVGSGVSSKDNIMQQFRDAKQKLGPEASVEDLASRAASRYMASTIKSVKTPKTAYDFEVSWRAISDDTAQQIQLLKNCGRSGNKYSVLELKWWIRLNPSGSFKPNIFKEDGRIACSHRADDDVNTDHKRHFTLLPNDIVASFSSGASLVMSAEWLNHL